MPVLLKHFGEGLKPEGVTIAADAAGLTIVFDTDRAPPRWTRWPF